MTKGKNTLDHYGNTLGTDAAATASGLTRGYGPLDCVGMGTQEWDAAQYVKTARFVAHLGTPVLDLLNPQPGERILDLGCGDGALTKRLAEAGVDVLGVDASPSMIASARARGLSAEVVNGEALAFDAEFNAVFSNAALHWMRDAEAVIRGVKRALKPGGRFVAEFGGEGNCAAVRRAMETVFARHPDFGAYVDPWFFPTPEAYRALLETEGFRVPYIELIPRPTMLEKGIREWLEVFTGGITERLDAGQRERFLVEAEALLRPVLFDGQKWVVDYVRLRFAATLAAGA